MSPIQTFPKKLPEYEQPTPEIPPTKIFSLQLYHEKGETERGIITLERYLATNDDIDFDIINILIELYMSAGEFEKAIQLIDKVSTQYSDLPVDIIVYLGICELYIGEISQAEVGISGVGKKMKNFQIHLNALYEQSPVSYGDMYYNVAETYMAVAEYERAVSVFQALLANSDYDRPLVWLRMAKCYRLIGQLSEAVQYYENGKSKNRFYMKNFSSFSLFS